MYLLTGLGLLVKKSVYACCIGLVLWEVYLNSPLFNREVPMLSLEEALVGYPVNGEATPRPAREPSSVAEMSVLGMPDSEAGMSGQPISEMGNFLWR